MFAGILAAVMITETSFTLAMEPVCYSGQYFTSIVAVSCAVQDGQYVRSASILRLVGEDPEHSDTGTLDTVGSLASSSSSILRYQSFSLLFNILFGYFSRAVWHPTGSSPLLAAVDDKSFLHMWNISGAKPQVSM